ncbi:MAG: T9SS type A sorting domain-containing protein [Bacteroidales bacterium]|nr:T9SS type A sorting domain-containing protein [Bacteroidales bacterium]MDD4216269.1 T9SS type A sorting domain-containing protein [Bacteroidales bacterium]MDY0142936.1 T9SS type A sorting domain-containing protein [Bacteroidales bacterium]
MKTKFYFLLILVLCFSLKILAQYSTAHIDADNNLKITIHTHFSKNLIKSHKANQLIGWPKAFQSNPSFKNMRGVCLEDMNSDGADEIIFAADNKLYVYNGLGVKLWEADLLGTAIYPPAVADINNNGSVEVVQITGGSGSNARIHVFDENGASLDGWPVSINGNWLVCSAALADIDNDKNLEILVAERSSLGRLHVLKNDGTSFDGNWPVELDAYPAVTPSIAYNYKLRNETGINALVQNLIVMCSTKSIFAFDTDGNILDGFPIENENTSFSYQSPLICDDLSKTEIIGSSHGNLPEFYDVLFDGLNSGINWSVPTVGNSWTYSPPTAIGLNETFDFYLFGQPGANGTDNFPTIHAFDPQGNYINGFPYERTDGLEGFITAMYSVDFDKLYVFTGSNSKDVNGFGYIHAYSANIDLSNFTEMPGFPIEVQGFTFMNGVNLGDVNNNQKLDLVVLSYDLDFQETDSVHINVFEMDDIIYNPDYCYGTYKSNNLRNGYVNPFRYSADIETPQINNSVEVYPRVFENFINIELNSNSKFDAFIYSSQGQLINKLCDCEKKCTFNVQDLAKGIYFVKVKQNNNINTFKLIKL